MRAYPTPLPSQAKPSEAHRASQLFTARVGERLWRDGVCVGEVTKWLM
jgi:hypothetical protein